MNKKYLYLSLSIIPVIVGAVSFWLLLSSPYTGLHYKQTGDKWYVSKIESGTPAALYPQLIGQEIISITGHQIGKNDLYKEPDNIKTWLELQEYWQVQRYLADSIHIGKSFDLITKDDHGNTTLTQITPAHRSWQDISKIFFYFLLANIFFIISFLVFIKKPDDISALMFYITGVFVFLTTPITFMWNYIEVNTNIPIVQLLYFLQILGNMVATVTIFHFIAAFPRDTLGLTAKRWFIPVIYISAIVVIILFSTRVAFSSYYIFLLVYILTGMYMIYRQYKNLNLIEKLQMRWIFGGFSFFLFMDLFLYTLPPLVIGHRLINEMLMNSLIFLLPLSIAFAIMKYKLMDIDTLFDNTLIYSVTIGLLAMIDVAIVYILTSNKIPLLVFKEPFPTIIAVWVIIFTYLPVRNRVRDIIKRLLKREMYDLNEVSTSYSKSLLSVYSTDDVTKMARDVIERTLHPKSIEIDILDNPRELKPVINTEAGEAFIPLSANIGAIGLMMLGEKHSGRLYDRNDIKLLNMIANQTALAIESIRHREGIRLKEEENRQEKERISKEIHDGIGSSLVQAKLLLNMAGKDPDVIHEAANVIDSGIKEMRELIWVVEQDEQTLGDLVYHIEGRLEQAKSLLNINIDTNIENENITLTPEQKLNISRIVQESMTNIIKHAQATKVDISFIQQGKGLSIMIKDDGKGFNTSKTGSESYGLRNMRARAEKIGAQLQISSEIGKGSEVRLEIRL